MQAETVARNPRQTFSPKSCGVTAPQFEGLVEMLVRVGDSMDIADAVLAEQRSATSGFARLCRSAAYTKQICVPSASILCAARDIGDRLAAEGAAEVTQEHDEHRRPFGQFLEGFAALSGGVRDGVRKVWFCCGSVAS